ncbi:tetratricopeptide repeat protein [Myroides sp. LJL116]
MVNKSVTVLRKEGKLEEALQLARQNLNANPQDLESKLTLGWVYYDFLKKFAIEGDFDSFMEYFQNISTLGLPEVPNLLFDSLAWPIRSLLEALMQRKQWNFIRANQLFNILKTFSFTRPSETFSLLIRTLNQGFQNYNNYTEVLDWCTLDNFEAQDYIEPFFNGRKSIALVEQIYINYAKCLLQGDAFPDKAKRRQKLEDFQERLAQLMLEYPNYVYPAYYRSKILLELGDQNQALKVFLPFARIKSNNYWVWEMLAQLYHDNQPYAFSCYCKALSLPTREEFLIKVRQEFCSLLVQSKMYVEARTEIFKILQVSQQSSLTVPNQVNQWIKQPWYEMVRESDSNYLLYKRYKGIAEELLYQDIEPIIIVAEFIHQDKKILHFIQSKNLSGFIKYDGFIKDPVVGELFEARLQKEGDNGFYVVQTLKRAKDAVSEAVKSGHGVVRILPEGIGFIGDVYFDKQLLEKNFITNESAIQYKAFMVYNKKRKQWGWKAFQASLLNTNTN